MMKLFKRAWYFLILGAAVALMGAQCQRCNTCECPATDSGNPTATIRVIYQNASNMEEYRDFNFTGQQQPVGALELHVYTEFNVWYIAGDPGCISQMRKKHTREQNGAIVTDSAWDSYDYSPAIKTVIKTDEFSHPMPRDIYIFRISARDCKGNSTEGSVRVVFCESAPGNSLSKSLSWSNDNTTSPHWTGELEQHEIEVLCSERRIHKIILPLEVVPDGVVTCNFSMSGWHVRLNNTYYTGFTCDEDSQRCTKVLGNPIPLQGYEIEAWADSHFPAGENCMAASVDSYRSISIRFELE